MNWHWSRRDWIKAVVVGSTGWGVRAPAAEVPPARGRIVDEPARQVPVVGDWDVIVAGGGPAGTAAALASARLGARTCLVEAHGCLGGIWTAGLLCWILDHANKRGIMEELWQELNRRGGRVRAPDGRFTNAYDPEIMKLVLDELTERAGVDTWLHTRVVSVRRDGRRITHVFIESCSGREALAGKVFVDATGNGDVAANAGCGFDLGHPETGRTQPMTLMALVTGVRAEEIQEFFRHDDRTDWAAPKDRLRSAMERAGKSPSYSKPTLFRIYDDLFALMANHEYDVVGTNVRDVTRATRRARREVHELVNALRTLGLPWSEIRIVATAEQVGIREGRRIHGRYRITAEDLREGRRHEDAIAEVRFGIDVHALDPRKEKGIQAAPFKSRPYDLPLRALIAADVDNLLMAGRCISGDFWAHSSYRVTGNAVAMGQAAGVAAALAARSGRAPFEVPFEEVAAHLPKQES